MMDEEDLGNQAALDDEDRRALAQAAALDIDEPLPSPEIAFGFTFEELIDVTLSNDPKVQRVRIGKLAELIG